MWISTSSRGCEKGPFLPPKSKKTAEQIDDDGEYNTQQNHRNYREVHPGTAPLYADITGQIAEPAQLTAKYRNDES